MVCNSESSHGFQQHLFLMWCCPTPPLPLQVLSTAKTNLETKGDVHTEWFFLHLIKDAEINLGIQDRIWPHGDCGHGRSKEESVVHLFLPNNIKLSSSKEAKTIICSDTLWGIPVLENNWLQTKQTRTGKAPQRGPLLKGIQIKT